MMARVAFLGLGVMGYPMAGHLAKAGHAVQVWNRTRVRAEDWAAGHKGSAAGSAAEAVAGAEIVFTCVGNDRDIAEVARAAFSGMKKGAVFVDHTTASAEIARVLAGEAAAKGIGFLDAPVSGGEAGAQNGALTVMVGGEAEVFARAEPVILAYARSVKLLGPAGSGQVTKMANQIAIAGLLQGLAEAMHFAKRSGVDPEAIVEVISKGAAQSWQMDNRAKTMIAGKYDFGFAVKWMQKDLAICLEEGRSVGASLPVTALVDQFYAEVAAMGGARWDTSSLMARLEAAGAKARDRG